MPQHPWRDRLLVAGFVLVAWLPLLLMLAGPTVQLLGAENREASPWPRLALHHGMTAEFEHAFADRFGGRDQLAALHHRLHVWAFRTSPVPKVLLGRSDWLFYNKADARLWTTTGADQSPDRQF